VALTIPAYTLNAVTIGTTEWSITTNTAGPDNDTTDGHFDLFVGVPAAATYADLFEVALYETINAVQYKLDAFPFRGNGAAYGIAYPGLTLGIGWDMTIKKLSGTDRALSAHINRAA